MTANKHNPLASFSVTQLAQELLRRASHMDAFIDLSKNVGALEAAAAPVPVQPASNHSNGTKKREHLFTRDDVAEELDKCAGPVTAEQLRKRMRCAGNAISGHLSRMAKDGLVLTLPPLEGERAVRYQLAKVTGKV